MNIEIETLEHGVTSVETSGEASTSRYTETYCNWNFHVISGQITIIVTSIHMDMAIVVYESGRGRKCIFKVDIHIRMN